MIPVPKVPSIVWKLVALAAAFLLGAYLAHNYTQAKADAKYSKLQATYADLKTRYDKKVNDAETNIENQGKTQDANDQQRLADLESQVNSQKRDLASAAATADRLRQHIARLQRPAPTPKPTGEREGVQDFDAIELFGRLLYQHGENAGALADQIVSLGGTVVELRDYSSRLRAAGMSCEARYDTAKSELDKLRVEAMK